MSRSAVAALLSEPDTRIVALTGAGVSAESGIPTFRGEEGYWREGSSLFTPMEMATFRMFHEAPERVWAWYLMRLECCRAAEPNPGHEALKTLESLLSKRFRLVTQNVDNLHLRAGNLPHRTWEIHGNIEWMRCSAACGASRIAHGPTIPQFSLGENYFRCPACAALMRPHVLWFDEMYSEELYRAESAFQAASEATLLVVCGTSGGTNLPLQMARIALQSGAFLLDINPAQNPFSAMALDQGEWWQMPAATGLPKLLSMMTKNS